MTTDLIKRLEEESEAKDRLMEIFMTLVEALAEECDADLSDSFININANSPSGSRELAKVSVQNAIDGQRARIAALKAKDQS